MNVLLTGHHGYVGSVMAPVLLAAGHHVQGWDTFYFEGCDFLPDPATVPHRALDVRDVADPARLEGFDAVVHYAALSNDPIGQLNPALTEDINFRATVAVARAAREAGVRRFIYASSCSIYGASGGDAPVDERGELRPLTAYAVSKVSSEEELAKLADARFSPVFMRNATAYGVSPRLRVDLVLNNLAAWAVTTGKIRILSDGMPWRPLVHIEDISRVACALLAAPREAIHAEAFNVGATTENYRVRELAEIVREVVPECEVEYAGRPEADARNYRVDFGKLARAFPDLALQWTARPGARQLVEAYRAHGLSLEEFQGRKYVRVNQLRHLLGTQALAGDLRWRAPRA